MKSEAGLTLNALNAASASKFSAALAGIWENSPWIVEAVADQRPFASVDALGEAMEAVVRSADEAAQLALLRAHPDLAGQPALAGELTPESAREQSSVGLDRLTPREREAFQEWNARYRQTFGFPFILCLRGRTKNSIRAALRSRLGASVVAERATALREICAIARLRLRDRVKA